MGINLLWEQWGVRLEGTCCMMCGHFSKVAICRHHPPNKAPKYFNIAGKPRINGNARFLARRCFLGAIVVCAEEASYVAKHPRLSVRGDRQHYVWYEVDNLGEVKSCLRCLYV